MKVLVVGGGGREHALAWKLASEPIVHEVAVCAGQPRHRVDRAERRVSARPISPRWRPWPIANRIDLTVVGPELPLDRGIVDLFTSRGLRIFGPTRAAAQLECSKVFAKTLHGAPRHSDRELSRVRRCAGRALRSSSRANLGFRSSSRRMVWRPARVSSSQRIAASADQRHSCRDGRAGSSARLARASCSRNVSTGLRSRSSRCATAPARLR